MYKDKSIEFFVFKAILKIRCVFATLAWGYKISNISYMIDQSHNVTDPIESLILSANEIVNSYAKSLLVNYSLLEKSQDGNDAIQSMQILKTAFNLSFFL